MRIQILILGFKGLIKQTRLLISISYVALHFFFSIRIRISRLKFNFAKSYYDKNKPEAEKDITLCVENLLMQYNYVFST